MVFNTEIPIYGFKAKVTVSEGTYSGEIEALHIVTQAKTLKQLRQRLEEATELTVDSVIKHPSEVSNYPVLAKKLGLKVYA